MTKPLVAHPLPVHGSVTIRELGGSPSPELRRRFVQIAQPYYPARLRIRDRIEAHLAAGAHVRIAEQAGHLLGFALSTCARRETPFHPRPIPCIYQRELFVAPEGRGRNLGVRLQIATFRHHLGRWWLLRRFLLYCQTHNPTIVKNYRLFTRYYPRIDGAPVPRDVRAFAEKRLPELGGTALDENLRIHGSFKTMLAGVDYTPWWETYLATGDSRIDDRVLAWLFRRENGRIIHSGLSLLMIGYAKPLNFLRRFVEISLRIRKRAATEANG